MVRNTNGTKGNGTKSGKMYEWYEKRKNGRVDETPMVRKVMVRKVGKYTGGTKGQKYMGGTK